MYYNDLDDLNNDLSNTPIYNPDDDYFYINDKKWIKAGLNRFILYSAEDYVNMLTPYSYGRTSGLPIDISKCNFTSLYLDLYGADGKTAAFYANKIDVTNYSYLCVKSSPYSGAQNNSPEILLIDSVDGYVDTKNIVADLTTIASSGTFKLDISSITGEYYPVILAVNGRGAYVYEFWLE